MKGTARTEYIFAEIDEEIEIKLQSQQFRNIESKEAPCSAIPSYSDLKVYYLFTRKLPPFRSTEKGKTTSYES